jgi:predicted PurR-regulated permease PerM
VTSSERERRGAIAYAITLFFAGVLALWLLFLIRHVLLVLYVAGLLAIGFSPMVRRLEKRRGRRRARLPRWAAILIVYTILLAVIAAAIAVVVPPLVGQAGELWRKLPDYVDNLQNTLTRYGLISHRYTWSEMLRTVPAPGNTAARVLGAIQGVLGAIGGLVTILVLPYYLLLEAQTLNVGFLRWFPQDRRDAVGRITRDVTLKVSAWLGGQLLLSFIIGSTAALGLWLLGVPYFYVLALLCGLGELIPIIGPILAGVPAILVGFTVSIETGVFTAIYFLVQQFVENHFLVPRVMQRQVGLSAVSVVAALLIGSELLGVVGALLAVPTAAIVQIFVQQHLDSRPVSHGK